MSREIKFRGKRKDNGEWVYGWYAYIQGRHYIVLPNAFIGSQNGIHYYVEVDPETVGQSTGLHDKNGKEIYEGDILKWDRSSMPATIEFDFGKFTMRIETPKGPRWYDMCSRYEFYDNNLDEHEIIGTIHDSEATNAR